MAMTEKLIEIVKNYPILYNLTDEDYKNIRKKDKIWEQIGRELGGNGEEMKKKWKNLRDSYTKHLRSLNTNADENAQKLKNWQWAKQMEKFRPFMTSAKIELNMDRSFYIDCMTSLSPPRDTQKGDIISTDENIIFVETKAPSMLATTTALSSKKKFQANLIKRRRKRIGKTLQGSATAKLIKQPKQKPKSNHNGNNMDAIDLIFLGYAKTVKTFSPRLRVIAKLKLAELMSQLELEDTNKRLLL